MKSLLCALGVCLMLCATPAVSQTTIAQLTPAEWLAKIQADKRGLVAKAMDLTPEEAKKFWPLYDTFQRELAVPQSSYTRAVLDVVAAGNVMTDANAKRLVDQVLSASADEVRLQQKHFKQLLKVLPAHKAARYMHVEGKIQAVVRYETAAAIPLLP